MAFPAMKIIHHGSNTGIRVDMSLMLSYPVRRSPKGLSSPRSSLPASSINTDDGQPGITRETGPRLYRCSLRLTFQEGGPFEGRDQHLWGAPDLFDVDGLMRKHWKSCGLSLHQHLCLPKSREIRIQRGSAGRRRASRTDKSRSSTL